jgi:transposase-like protein
MYWFSVNWKISSSELVYPWEENQMTKQRKHYSPSEKVRLLKRHLVDKIPVSDLCDEHGMSPTVFYRWQKQFFERGELAFSDQRKTKEKRHERRIRELEAKLALKNEVVSELLEAHIKLKKNLGVL